MKLLCNEANYVDYTDRCDWYYFKNGYYGGTYAHSDSAMPFAIWISSALQLYIMKDRRESRLSLHRKLNRAIPKWNYRIHTDASKDNLLPPELTSAQVPYILG